jgi:DNA mismatch repair protein MutS
LEQIDRKYHQFKDRHPNILLLFRVGDFYEMFRADAETAHKALGLTLTRRGEIALCGVPHHQLEQYLKRLIDKGIRCAVVELETIRATT